MRVVEDHANREEFPVYVRIIFGVLSLCATYLALRGMRLDSLWKKMMAVEVHWFTVSVFVVIAVSFMAFVLIRKRMFRNPLTSAILGGFIGFIAGAIACVVAGHVRDGMLFRLITLMTHPVDQAVVVFMTTTWLLGVMAFLMLHLISVIAAKVYRSKRAAS